MELKFSKVVNRELKKTEMYLYGDLGSGSGEVNGHYFAQELAWLGRNYDEIKIRLNSGGGDVLHGLSVVSEMMASKAYIIVSVDGIAASMAAVLLPAADRVEMNDYARIMIHSAYYADQEGSAVKNLTEKQKKGVKNVTDILTALLAKRGITTERIAELMKTDSWFDAESALTEKLIDAIVTTGKKAELAAYEPLKLVAAIKSELSINENNLKSMKRIASKFGLPEDATEETILAKITENEGSVSEKMVNQLVAVGRALGTVTDENVEKVKRLAKADFDLASEMYLKVEKPEGDEKPEAVNGGKGTLIKNLIDGKKPEKVEKKWDELGENEIEALRDKDRPAYARLFKAHYGFEPVIE